ncbi:dienelactone hydrolase endo-1,3,1,4-beta-D-glucanase [Gymnopilus junonius]|uniref:Dienelactone hydrolase endo-1,3,1,4-beta-D-glucanase n=1 Tax=Gymnopilus junonius TaxID=109634 RepID=A0A9P5NSA8_GYMJU|nr:dienelactone hydrolase endo-1,3,1,4-beta-D-glucanase [Gymnopilus junonius]
MACPDCISGGDDDPSKRTVLLLTDAFGLPLKNCKIMADKFSKILKCDVWIPDYFNVSIPLNALNVPTKAFYKRSTWDWIRFFAIAITRIPAFISNRPTVVDKRLESLIALLREKKKYEKIGAVGYCFGGSACVRIGGTDLVNSIIIAHPGKFTLDQVKAIKVPAAWVCAEDDMFFSNTLRNQSEAVFKEKEGKDNFVEYEFKEYKGTGHGFASRPTLELPEIKAAYEGAFAQTVDWFNKTLAIQ